MPSNMPAKTAKKTHEKTSALLRPKSAVSATAVASIDQEYHNTWHRVVRTYGLCSQLLTIRARSIGLSLPEHEVLQNLLAHPGLPQQALAERLFTVKSHLSSIVRKLEHSGLIEKSHSISDARAWSLSLTTRGRQLAEQGHALQLALISSMVEPIDPVMHDAFSKAMKLIETQLLEMHGISKRKYL